MSEFRPRPGEVDEILRRGTRLRYRHAAVTGLAVGIAALAVVVPTAVDRAAIQPTNPGVTATATTTATATPDEPPATATPVTTTPGSAAATTAPVAGPTATATSGFRCAPGGNGGATDRGVTGDDITLFTTAAPTGPLAPNSTWREVQRVLVDRTNRAGGICGRLLRLEVADDGNADTTARQLREAMETAFAIPFIGLADGLAAVVDDLARTRTPVVGVPSRARTFYDAEWIWPAGVSDADAARLMVREAYQRGARSFGVVFDEEAAGAAFDAEVVRLTGQHARQVDFTGCRMQCTDSDVVSGVSKMYTGSPDFVGVLVPHMTAAKWMGQAPGRQSGRFPPYGHGGTDVFLDPDVRDICRDQCHGLRAWSAYKTDCGSDGYVGDAAYDRYRADLAALAVDETPDTAAVYAATQLLLDALRRTGPNLTRDRLGRMLDGAPLRVDLTVGETVEGRNDTMRAYVLSWNAGDAGCSFGPLARL